MTYPALVIGSGYVGDGHIGGDLVETTAQPPSGSGSIDAPFRGRGGIDLVPAGARGYITALPQHTQAKADQ